MAQGSKEFEEQIAKVTEAHRRIAEAMSHGELRCAQCGAVRPLNGEVRLVEMYLFTIGWPKCCCETMGFYPPKDYLRRVCGVPA